MNPIEIISISKFKATCLAVLDNVKKTGQPILVTKRGEPIAIIDPPPPPEKRESWLGMLKSKGKIVGDILEPAVPANEWRVMDE